METFAAPKDLVENRLFSIQRRKMLDGLSDDMIDEPIVDIINSLNSIPHCFTLQCCWGHFLYPGHEDPYNTDPLPDSGGIVHVEYKIAYIAFCIENHPLGRKLLADLKHLITIDPESIQICSAEWFWAQQVNSYALQAEPDRFKNQDTAIMDYKEALHIEKVRNTFFKRLKNIIDSRWKGGFR